jgi:hypothetical protein
MGPALLLIAQLYRVENLARGLTVEEKLSLRQLQSRSILDKLRNYLLEIQAEILPKSPAGRAVRYALKNWAALTRYCDDGAWRSTIMPQMPRAAFVALCRLPDYAARIGFDGSPRSLDSG